MIQPAKLDPGKRYASPDPYGSSIERSGKDFTNRKLFNSIISEHELLKKLRPPDKKGSTEISELDSMVQEKYIALVKSFPELEKFDFKSIFVYPKEDEPSKRHALAGEFFAMIVCKMCQEQYSAGYTEDGAPPKPPSLPLIPFQPTASSQFLHQTLTSDYPVIQIKTIKDELLKIFVIHYVHVSEALVQLSLASTSPEAEKKTIGIDTSAMIIQREIINEFMLLLLHDQRNHSILNQYDYSLAQYIRKYIAETQEKIIYCGTPTNIDEVALAQSFIAQLFSLAMLGSYSENRKFFKNASMESIKGVYDVMMRSLEISCKSGTMNDIYSRSCTGKEVWKKAKKGSCCFKSILFARKKISVLYLTRSCGTGIISEGYSMPTDENSIGLSAKYVNLYYLNKLSKIMISRGMYLAEEREKTMSAVSEVLNINTGKLKIFMDSIDEAQLSIKKTQSEISEAKKINLDMILNENLLGLKIFLNLLFLSDDPSGNFEKLGVKKYFKNLLFIHMAVALKNKMVILPQNEAGIAEYSFKTAKDYISEIIMFLFRMKHIISKKPQEKISPSPPPIQQKYIASSFMSASSARSGTQKLQISMFADELMLDILQSLNQHVAFIKPGMTAIKSHLVEYICENGKQTLTAPIAEYVVKLTDSNLFRFTAPESYPLTKDNVNNLERQLDKQTNGRLVGFLHKIVGYEKIWAGNIITHFLMQIKNTFKKPSSDLLFGQYKLLYSILINRVYDDAEFAECINVEALRPLTYKMILQKDITKSEINDKAAHAMMDLKVVIQLIEFIMEKYENIKEGIQNGNTVATVQETLSLFNISTFSPVCIHLTEGIILLLSTVPALSDAILKSPKITISLLKKTVQFPNCKPFVLCLIQKCLMVVKYCRAPPTESEKSYFLPVIILEFIKSQFEQKIEVSEKRDELYVNMIPWVALITEFLEYDKDFGNLLRYSAYQLIIYQQFSRETLNLILNIPAKTKSGNMLLEIFKCIQAIVFNNEAVKEKMKENLNDQLPSIISPIVKQYIQKNCIQEADITLLLVLLFSIIFEVPAAKFPSMVPNDPQAKYLIKQPLFLPVLFKMMHTLLKCDPSTYIQIVANQITLFIKLVENSYFNYSIMSNYYNFHPLLKLMHFYKMKNEKILRIIASFLTEISIIDISSQCLKEFVSELSEFHDTSESPAYVNIILDSVLQMLKEISHREIFVFSGQEHSGIGVVPKSYLPKDGYCLFGWIRLERPDQTDSILNKAQARTMCIYKLGASKEMEIELFIQDNMLHYSVKDIKNKTAPLIIPFQHKLLVQDEWCFIELYHINNEQPRNLQLYINGDLVKETQCRKYYENKNYDENSVGCEILIEYINQEGEERLRSNFRGEMSALHFAEVNSGNLYPTHFNIMKRIFRFISMHELFPIIAFGEKRCDSWPMIKQVIAHKELVESKLLERIFLIVNPKYASKFYQVHEKIYTSIQRGGYKLELTNHVERIYKHAKIHHNSPARDVLLNIGGIKIFMPLLYQLGEYTATQKFDPEFVDSVLGKVLQILVDVIVIDRERAAVFMSSENGILLLRYVMERIARNCGLKSHIFTLTSQILDTLVDFYPQLVEKYLLMIFLNVDIWVYSYQEGAQKIILDNAYSKLLALSKSKWVKSETIVESLLSCIEIYTNQDEAPKLKEILQFSNIIKLLSVDNLTEGALVRLMSYANAFYVRRLKNYPYQIYFILKILFELFSGKKEKVLSIIKEAIKKKGDSKIISTLFTILDYFLYLKECGSNLGYWGILMANKTEGDISEDTVSENRSERTFTIDMSSTESNAEAHMRAFLLSDKGCELVDVIISICVYILFGVIDWYNIGMEFSSGGNYSLNTSGGKDLSISTGSNTPGLSLEEQKRRENANVLGFLVKFLMKADNKKMALLSYLFCGHEGRKTDLFGPITYSALISVVQEIPFHLENWQDLRTQLLKEALKSNSANMKIIRNHSNYELLLTNFFKFNKAAKDEIIHDLMLFAQDKRFFGEIFDSPSGFTDCIFDLAEKMIESDALIAIHKAFLSAILLEAKRANEFCRIFTNLSGKPVYHVELIDHLIKECLIKRVKFEDYPEIINPYLHMLYVLEDAITKDPSIMTESQDILMGCLAKILRLLDKNGLMYYSCPGLKLFEDKIISTGAAEKDFSTGGSPSFIQREGGIERIILKIIFALLKVDSKDSFPSISFLKYYILRDPMAKALIKGFVQIRTEDKVPKVLDKKSLKKKDVNKSSGSIIIGVGSKNEKLNLIELCHQVQEKKKGQSTLSVSNQIFQKTVYWNDVSMLTGKQVTKLIGIENIFEDKCFPILLIFAWCIQLIHYEMCGISSYIDFPSEEEIAGKLDQVGSKRVSFKIRCISLFLEDLIKCERKNKIDLEHWLQTELNNLLSAEAEKRILAEIKRVGSADIRPGISVYSFLDTLIKEPGGKKLEFQFRSKHIAPSFLKLSAQEHLGNSPFISRSGKESKSKEEEEKKGSLSISGPLVDALEQFKKTWWIFPLAIITSIEKDDPRETKEKNLIKAILSQGYVNSIHPYLMFITSHTFLQLDSAIYQRLHFGNKRSMMMLAKMQQDAHYQFVQELERRIFDKFSMIPIPKDKIERDELRQEFDGLAGNIYRKLKKELHWWELKKSSLRKSFNKATSKEEYEYVSKKYEKLIMSCTLYKAIKGTSQEIVNPLNGFCKLDSVRDFIGRAKVLKEHEEISVVGTAKVTMKYLRQFYLKKMLLSKVGLNSIIKPQEAKAFIIPFLFSDFRYSVFCQVMDCKKGIPGSSAAIEAQSSNPFWPAKNSSSNIDSLEKLAAIQKQASANQYQVINKPSLLLEPRMPVDEYIPKQLHMFEAEMITVKGTVFGKLMVNSVCITFKSEERRSGTKYELGSPNYSHLYVKINKKWRLDTVKEVIVKRYHLIRQAFEIYFENSKSVFFSLYNKKYQKRFIRTLNEIIAKKKGELKIVIVEEPEKYFLEKKFREKWVHWEISNFEYLMFLNKYGGRSFNDLGQYFVFPWIIQDYTSPKLNIEDVKTYRNLETPIAAISPAKSSEANTKLNELLSSDHPAPFQFGVHYLPARNVLSYLVRLEPYASLLIHTEQGQELTARLFHSLRQVWESVYADAEDNRELIPEFFYLPEMFGNYNKYSYGTKNAERALEEYVKKRSRVSVDQVILPKWAINHHYFIKYNSLALESPHASFSLHHWIDLVFGGKQQNPKYFNRFRELCDERFIKTIYRSLTAAHIMEIQEFGSNPIQLFTEAHPAKDKLDFCKKTEYSLFARSQVQSTESKFAMIKVAAFKSAITYIEAFEAKVLIVLNNQKIYLSREEYLNVPHERPIMFDKRDTHLFPYKKIFIEGSNHLTCDGSRSHATLDRGNYIVTCRHYDNSCKIINANTGEVIQHLYFHKTFVFTICATKDKKYLYSGSVDGVVAKWDLQSFKTACPNVVYHTCDHKGAIYSIDSSLRLDLVVSGSLDGVISIRTVSTGKFIRFIKPDLNLNNSEYGICQIRISYRGYIIIVARCKVWKLEKNDFLIVYSINNELIACKDSGDTINSLVLDESGYQIVAGGKSGKIMKYDILSLNAQDMLEDLDPELQSTETVLKELLATTTLITSLGITYQENCQQLLVGLSTGEFYTYKDSPRVTGGKIFDTLQGLIIGK